MDLELFSLDRTAERARISVRKLLQMIADGEGPTVTKMGRRTLVRSDHFKDWLDRLARRNGSGSVLADAAEFNSVPRINIDEAATRAGLSSQDLNRRIRDGDGPRYEVWRETRWIAVEELHRWLASIGRSWAA